MEMFGIALIEGIVTGSIYAIVALGFVLIYKSTRVINFAQGELMMVGAYVAYFFMAQVGLNLSWSLVATLVITAGLGIMIHYLFFKKMIGESHFTLVMETIALSYLLKSGVQLIAGAQSRVMPSILTGPNVQIMNIPVTRAAIGVVLFSIIFLVVFQVFFKFSKMGTAMRATANDQVAAMGCGVQVNVIFATAWAISFMLSSVAGVIMAGTYNLDTNLGAVGLLVFPVIILGGLDSIGGAIVGGYIIGLLESFSKAYLGQHFSTNLDIIPFSILVLILLIKPYGLFGTKRIERL